jgi:hypothetical protein
MIEIERYRELIRTRLTLVGLLAYPISRGFGLYISVSVDPSPLILILINYLSNLQ